MLLSGFAGLGYEMVWSKMLSLALGHEILAVLAVIAAFFTGLGIGAYGLDAAIRRSRNPAHWYVSLEILIGAWALALIVIIPLFNDLMHGLIGEQPSAVRHWGSVFGGTLILLLPATAAMGATLPALERVMSAVREDGWTVGSLYAANTFGAVAGTLLSTFLLAPAIGFSNTLVILAVVNFVCAAAIAAGRYSPAPSLASAPEKAGLSRQRLALTLGLTGLIGIGYEVVVIRVLSQVLENTVYTFASLLAVYLFGTALGAALYHRLAPRQATDRMTASLLVALSVASLIGATLLGFSDALYGAIGSLLSHEYATAILAEITVALIVFLLPTLFMGATFAHLAQLARDEFGVGRALGINTLGAALAPLVFGVFLLPIVGSKLLLVISSLAYLLLIPTGERTRPVALTVPALLALAVYVLPGPLRFVDVPEGGHLEHYEEGVMASVSVVTDGDGVHFLKVNNHYTMGSSESRFSDRRQTHIPLLLHPDPRDVLFLGLGTGSTFSAVAPHVETSGKAVELVPEVLPTLGYFGPSEDTFRDSERLQLIVSDARRFVGANKDDYDVIVSEVFHPSRDGAGFLYTVEHFEAIRDRLRNDGIFCQWLPLFQLDIPTLRSIVRSFTTVFPQSEAHLAHFSLGQPLVALVGRIQPGVFHRGWIADRVRYRALAEDLTSVRITTDFDLFGGFLGGADSLYAFAADSPLNTDEHPVVTFSAPGFVYNDMDPPHVRLLQLVNELSADAGDIVPPDSAGAEDFTFRLEDYWQARDAYLALGTRMHPDVSVEGMIENVAQPLLEIVHISSDFGPAYFPLLEMAIDLRDVDAVASRKLLDELEVAAPNRGEAARLRQQMFPN